MGNGFGDSWRGAFLWHLTSLIPMSNSTPACQPPTPTTQLSFSTFLHSRVPGVMQLLSKCDPSAGLGSPLRTAASTASCAARAALKRRERCWFIFARGAQPMCVRRRRVSNVVREVGLEVSRALPDRASTASACMAHVCMLFCMNCSPGCSHNDGHGRPANPHTINGH